MSTKKRILFHLVVHFPYYVHCSKYIMRKTTQKIQQPWKLHIASLTRSSSISSLHSVIYFCLPKGVKLHNIQCVIVNGFCYSLMLADVQTYVFQAVEPCHPVYPKFCYKRTLLSSYIHFIHLILYRGHEWWLKVGYTLNRSADYHRVNLVWVVVWLYNPALQAEAVTDGWMDGFFWYVGPSRSTWPATQARGELHTVGPNQIPN